LGRGAVSGGCRYFYDITDRAEFKANPDYKGVCHVALAQEGHTRPGEVLFGTDSHTCNAGAFGQFATGIGNTDAAFVLGTGKLLIKVCELTMPCLGLALRCHRAGLSPRAMPCLQWQVPASMKFDLNGDMPDYLLAKDIILQIIGDIGVAGATYRAMEFGGNAISQVRRGEGAGPHTTNEPCSLTGSPCHGH
jgi:3-isopropylmalate/(R)-2-methylmalate dehydratase large subunit